MSEQPHQPLTEDTLETMRDTLDGFAEYGDIEGLLDRGPDFKRLLAERNQLLTDLQWYISDLGPEHWQNCDGEDCYLCEGHVAIRDLWKDSRALGLDQDGQRQA